jgi:hypothetical protein
VSLIRCDAEVQVLSANSGFIHFSRIPGWLADVYEMAFDWDIRECPLARRLLWVKIPLNQ